MSAIDSLMRLHRWQLDERRRHVAELEELAERLRQEQYRLDAESEREQAAGAGPVPGSAEPDHVRQLVERRRKLVQSRAELAERIVRARDALAEAGHELRRYEIIIANRARQEGPREGARPHSLGGSAPRRGHAGKE